MQALLNVPATAAPDDIVEVRILVRHPMETGFRRDRHGKPVPRDIIRELRCTYLDEEVFRVQLFPAIAANPFFAFTIRAERTGSVALHWIDQAGREHGASRTLTVS